MTCFKKTKYTCGDTTYATCVKYEKTLPEFTKITDECYTIEETTEDLYEIVGEVISEIDLSALGQCAEIDYLDENTKIIVKNVLLKYEEEICTLKTKVAELESTAICDLPIAGCNFSLGTLADACDNPPQTFGELLQVLINQHNV